MIDHGIVGWRSRVTGERVKVVVLLDCIRADAHIDDYEAIV
jgi:uncharacterized protein (DUF433 family)